MAKNKDPAFLFYSSDFLAGAADLTMEERGQYITLLCLQHQKGHLSRKTLSLSVGTVSRDVLAKFKLDSYDCYYNERLEAEIRRRTLYSLSRGENGKKGGRPRKSAETEETIEKPYENHMESICKPYVKPYENHTENENITEDIINTQAIDSTPSKPIFSFSKEGESAPTSARATPSPEDVKAYCSEKGYTFAERFYAHFNAKGWDGVQNWKARADEWHHENVEREKAKQADKPRFGSFDAEEALQLALKRNLKKGAPDGTSW